MEFLEEYLDYEPRVWGCKK